MFGRDSRANSISSHKSSVYNGAIVSDTKAKDMLRFKAKKGCIIGTREGKEVIYKLMPAPEGI